MVTTDIEALLTQDVVRTENELTLLVKKPDYLGNSMWEFRLLDRTVARRYWTKTGYNGSVDSRCRSRPGDALRAIVKTETARGFEGHDVAVRYFVVRVLAGLFKRR